MQARTLRVGVVGHVEWVQFAAVEHVPRAGEVVHAIDPFEEPAGGGAVAAVQLARLAGEALLITALGDDECARRTLSRLAELGVEVRAQVCELPTRRALTLLDAAGERTITTIGDRLDPVFEQDSEPWSSISAMDAVYFTAGDPGVLRAAREGARVLVASPRARHALGHGVSIDALVLSADDELERGEASRFEDEVRLLVLTEGERGGSFRDSSGRTGRWQAALPPGEVLDSYGCGDTFAAGLTYGLGAGLATEEALELAARCGAACATGRGPYEHQLSGTGAGAEN